MTFVDLRFSNVERLKFHSVWNYLSKSIFKNFKYELINRVFNPITQIFSINPSDLDISL